MYICHTIKWKFDDTNFTNTICYSKYILILRRGAGRGLQGSRESARGDAASAVMSGEGRYLCQYMFFSFFEEV